MTKTAIMSGNQMVRVNLQGSDASYLFLPTAPNVSYPTCDCSTLEVISPDVWVTMDGYESPLSQVVSSTNNYQI